MRLFILSLSFITLLFSCGQNDNKTKDADTRSQAVQSAIEISYPVPDELEYNKKRDENADGSQPMNNSFYPIGWSKEGMFAYAEETSHEACCYDVNVYIQDTNTDSVLWKWSYEVVEETIPFEKIWKDSTAVFTKKLNKYGIMSQTFTSLEKFPFKTATNEYDFQITNKMIEDGEDNPINNTTITLLKNGVENKHIYFKEYGEAIYESEPNELYSEALTNKIAGYLKNPYENRIALFYITEERGYEGPPNVLKFQIIGHLFDNK